jgi:hypothetical protein
MVRWIIVPDPDLVPAIPELAAAGLLPPAAAPRLLRLARGELLSVRNELRALLYAGVLLTTAGIGLLVKQNLDHIGPLAIALFLAAASVAALAWVLRVTPPFSWHEVPSPNLAYDYILLLGLLLGAADLAFCEARFGLLAAHASWPLPVVALAAGLAACRCDSRVAFSLALSSLAAWWGVSLERAGTAVLSAGGELRWHAMACGVLFVALGTTLARTGRKAHFEPVAAHLGWLLILAAEMSGLAENGATAVRWSTALILTGGGLAWAAFRGRRFPLFGYGVVAAYIGVTRLLATLAFAPQLGCLWFAGSSVLMILGFLAAHRRLREPA